jgi:hypothetical protein
MVRPERFELPTTKFVAWYSIQLSYGRAVKLLLCLDTTEKSEEAEARSGIIQVDGMAVNTLCEVFLKRRVHPPENLGFPCRR